MRRLLYNLFVPHEHNDFHPHLLQKVAMGGMSFLVLLTFILANIQALVWPSVSWLVGAVLPAVIVAETNSERAQDHLDELTRSVTLDRAAQMKAEDMATNGYFDHYSPAGVSPWHWFDVAGYQYVYAGENLAVHFTDSSAVVDAWMHSPTHRANIMNGMYKEIGIGIAEGKYEGYKTIFVVQLFGTPITQTAVATVEQTPTFATNATPEAWQEVSTSSVLATGDASVDFLALVPSSSETVDTQVLGEEVVATGLPTTTLQHEPVQLDRVPWYGFLTQPNTVLATLYALLAAFVALVLATSLTLEWRRHNPLQVAYSFGLLLLMGGLLLLQGWLVGNGVIV